MNVREQRDFFQHLHQLIQARIPMPQAVALLATQYQNTRLGPLVDGLKEDTIAGVPLSEALTNSLAYLDHLTVTLIKTGEQTGEIETVLAQIVQNKQNVLEARQAIKSASLYPCMSLLLGIGVVIFMLLWVIPTFGQLYNELNRTPPVATQWLLAISERLRHPTWDGLMDGIIGVAMMYLVIQAMDGYRLLQKLPVIGQVMHYRGLMLVARTLVMVLKAGIPLPEGLMILSRMMAHPKWQHQIQQLSDRIASGESLAESMKQFDGLPFQFQQMVAVGEASGELEAMLVDIARVYETAFNEALGSLKMLLEPILMTVLGCVIGGLLIVLYLPIFKLGMAI